MNPPDYGAIGFHAKGRRWFINLYLWRRGPWRLSWSWHERGGHLETPMLNTILSRTITDILWGLRRNEVRHTMKARYEQRLPILRAVARAHGYALGLHGSTERDLDLIAVPWVEEASEVNVLVEALRLAIDGVIVQAPAQKPHGRVGYSIQIGGGLYIDLSVIARRAGEE